jgi:hypothetical protein
MASGVAPTAADLLGTIGKYIPTDVSALWIAVAGGIATVSPPVASTTKFNLAILVAVLAALATWALGHGKLHATHPDVNLIDSLLAGLYEILAAGVAFFIWATAMPGSWYDFGPNAAYMPLLLVGAATIVIGGVAVLLDRDRTQ